MMVGNTDCCSGNVNKALGCTYMMIWYDEKMIGNTRYCSGNVKNGPSLFLWNGFLMDMMNTWMRSRPTSNMKKGWLCRNILCWIYVTYWTRWEKWKQQRWWISDDEQMCWWLWRENTFLVKRECCCNCNFERYFDVYYHYILLYPHQRCFPYVQDVIIVYGHWGKPSL